MRSTFRLMAMLSLLAAATACQDNQGVTTPRIAANRPASRSVTPGTCAAVLGGLVSHWTGDGTTADALGTNNGIATGNVSYAPGMVGDAFSLAGDGYVFVPNSATMPAGAAARTWTFWLYVSASQWDGDRHTPFHTGGQEFQRAFSLDFDGYPNLQFYTWGYDASFDSGMTSPDGWMHVAMTYDGNHAVIYTNGQAMGQLSGVLDTDASFGAKFGAFPEFNGGPAFFAGLIDDAALYDRALTADEVTAIYNAGSGGICAPTPAVLTTVAISTVQTLASSGAIEPKTASTIIDALQQVADAIQSNAPVTSVNGKLNSTDNKIDAALNSHKITQATADKLHGAVNAIRGKL
jgi:hypothetical protein